MRWVYEWLKRLRSLLSALSYRTWVATFWEFECYDSQGNLKWRDSFWNLVVTEGRNELLTRLCKTIPGSVAWYVGLKGTGTVVAGDLMNSHAGWSELTPYSDTNRPAFTPGTVSAGSVDNDASKAVFNINASSTIYGGFVTDNNTKGGTTGKLYGGGDFGAPRGVESGDTLNVKVTLSVSST